MRTPGRIAAAIEILEDIGTRRRPANDALRDWGQRHRFAGAGDRAAIGNLVHDALRRRSSYAWLMDDDQPRALALAAIVCGWGFTVEALRDAFIDDAHAPAPLSDREEARLIGARLDDAPAVVRSDVPDWLEREFAASLGPDWCLEGAALAERPPLDLRVNLLKTDRETAIRQLARLGASATGLSPVALRIAAVAGPQRMPKVTNEAAFRRGRIEIQDEGSQIAALLVGARPGEQVLDLCAGAGGKTLAMAAAMANRGQVHAFDADRHRLASIYERLKRAGVRNVQVHQPDGDAPRPPDDLVGRMDRVLVDAPCSGTGTWRRRPDSKWRLKPEAFARRTAEQARALDQAAPFVRSGGFLAYATCSVLRSENDLAIEAFLNTRSDFRVEPATDHWNAVLDTPLPAGVADQRHGVLLTPARVGTDGFYIAILRRA